MANDNASLTADVEAWMENNSVELQASIQTIINNAISTMSKDLRIRALNFVDVTLGLVSGTAAYTIPKNASMLAMREFSFNVSGTRYQTLKKRTLGFCDEYWPDRALTGVPKYYADYDATQWLLSPTPNLSCATRVAGKAAFAPFSAVGDTNWLVTNHYDFALTACLLEASRFVIDDRQDGLIQVNSAQYVRLRDLINQSAKRLERDEDRRPTIDAGNAPSAPPDSEVE